MRGFKNRTMLLFQRTTLEDAAPKRRRINASDNRMQPELLKKDSEHLEVNDKMDTLTFASECPCGHLHGPCEDHYHDISAVGLSSNMMRGPP